MKTKNQMVSKWGLNCWSCYLVVMHEHEVIFKLKYKFDSTIKLWQGLKFEMNLKSIWTINFAPKYVIELQKEC